MAKYGSDVVKVEVKDGVEGAGSYVEVQTDLLDFPGLEKIAESEESHGFGNDWAEVVATGFHRVADITLRGYYDDTASTGTHALFNRIGSRTDVKITWDGTKTTETLMLIKSYNRLPERGMLTKFSVVLMAAEEPAEV